MLIILIGSLLLMLPFSTKDGQGASFFDALFTATSATCVTGLVVNDTYSYWTEFGQAIILLLIQIGGMGVVTMAIAISLFTGRKIGLRERYVMQESISAPQVGGIVRLTHYIIRTTFLLEAIGAVILAIRFIPEMGVGRGVWNAVFHSISAFCNAGFDLMGKNSPFSSLTGYTSDPIVNLVIILLIILGGIGFFAWHDITQNKLKFHVYRLQTKLVLITTGFLILIPFLYFLFLEFSAPVWRDMTWGERIWASLFQSVTPRTAGFNTVDLTLLGGSGVLLMILLMLIGGSPGSTAGGFKTTTFAVFILSVKSVFKRKDSLQCFGRRLPPEALRGAVTLFTLYIGLFLTGGILISSIDQVPLSQSLFETASAIGTVGLSLGITADLSMVSRCILIFLMYFGRVGGLTMIYAVANGQIPAPSQLPQEKITVG